MLHPGYNLICSRFSKNKLIVKSFWTLLNNLKYVKGIGNGIACDYARHNFGRPYDDSFQFCYGTEYEDCHQLFQDDQYPHTMFVLMCAVSAEFFFSHLASLELGVPVFASPLYPVMYASCVPTNQSCNEATGQRKLSFKEDVKKYACKVAIAIWSQLKRSWFHKWLLGRAIPK